MLCLEDLYFSDVWKKFENNPSNNCQSDRSLCDTDSVSKSRLFDQITLTLGFVEQFRRVYREVDSFV